MREATPAAPGLDHAPALAARERPGRLRAGSTLLRLAEQGLLPDVLLRAAIRRLLSERLHEIHAADPVQSAAESDRFAEALHAAPIALVPDLANAQHYEMPAEFFGEVLGVHRKYSSCLWSQGAATLDEAEAAALAVTAERAALADGQNILELGCGWGALALWMAARYPRGHITAVSNSHSQRDFIERTAHARGLRNLSVVTTDMNAFDPGARFDRVVSVEMFEHMRNWPSLFRRVRRWLAPEGRFFMHVFVHRSTPYPFVDRGSGDWMSRFFFSGGMMPSDDLALRFQDDLRLTARWRWSGTEYARTARAWLEHLDARRHAVLPILQRTYGTQQAVRWFGRWRLFFLACEELFGYDHGREWWVSHYLFDRRS
ncbi:MAG TPA: cyclopropane-fatty-acyl-phospholipid synthase family protein [Burkholderiales bacterium]|nr:cyclopropane-fatty-acyl-phospholipid synthase family protein [Burkholderiales bacterium]